MLADNLIRDETIMSCDPENLEPSIDRELRVWSARLDARPAPAVTARVHEAVRHEINELWLATQDRPAPSAAAKLRVQTAVGLELARARKLDGRHQPVRGRPCQGHSRQAGSALAAAAMLLLCVGIIRYASGPRSPDAGGVTMDAFVATLSSTAPTDAIQEAILDLESEFADDDTNAAQDDGSLDELVTEMDRILDEHQPAQQNSGIRSAEIGTWG